MATLGLGARFAAESRRLFGLSHGELGIVLWITLAIVSARFWPKAGEWLVRRLGGRDDAER